MESDDSLSSGDEFIHSSTPSDRDEQQFLEQVAGSSPLESDDLLSSGDEFRLPSTVDGSHSSTSSDEDEQQFLGPTPLESDDSLGSGAEFIRPSAVDASRAPSPRPGPSSRPDSPPRNDNRTTQPKYKRKSKICRFCGTRFVRLDRHLKAVHHLTASQMRSETCTGRTPQGRRRKVCPFPRCKRGVAFLTTHLQRRHKLLRGSDDMRRAKALASATTAQQPTTALAQNEKDKYAAGFLKWLMSIRGRALSDRNARQHVHQAAVVRKAVGSLNSLTTLNADRLESWVDRQSESGTKQPGTLRSYLISVGLFLEHLAASARLPGDMVELRQVVKNLSKSLRTKVALRQTQLNKTALQNLIPAEGYMRFKTSDYAKTATQLIMDGRSCANQADFIAARDFVVATLLLTNAQRVSAVAGIVIEDILQAASSSVADKTYKTISVSSHKTAASRGLANFSMPREDYVVVNTFARTQVQLLRKAAEDIFVSSFDGSPMNASSLNKALNRAWAKAGMSALYGSISATLNRKTVTTKIREQNPQLAQPLSQLMNHSSTTAERFYQLRQSQRSSALTVHAVAAGMETIAEQEAADDLREQASATPPTDTPALHVQDPKLAMVTRVLLQPCLLPQKQTSTDVSPERARPNRWSPAAEDELLAAFQDLIDVSAAADRKIRTPLIRARIQTWPFHGRTIQQVRDKLWNLAVKKMKTPPKK